MINFKKIWKENKDEIICGAIIGGLAAATILTRRYYKGNFDLIPKNHSSISWKPNGKFITLEKAKELLDLATKDGVDLAIVKDREKYMAIVLHRV